MAFTIEVERKGKDQEFDSNDLKLFHQECGGGHIDINFDERWWHLKCGRCHTRISVWAGEAGTASIAKTSIDGQKRSIEELNSHEVFAVQRD